MVIKILYYYSAYSKNKIIQISSRYANNLYAKYFKISKDYINLYHTYTLLFLLSFNLTV